MIIGTGIDIVEIDRVKNAVDKNPRFLERIFTYNEISYIKSRNNNKSTIAGLFAAKEAVSKALGSGISGFNWTDIEIYKETTGKPSVKLLGKARELSDAKGIRNIHISISHNRTNAVAFAVAEDKKLLKKDYIDLSNIDENCSIIDTQMVNSIIPQREKDTHKGTYGRVGVMGGCREMTGAVVLASKSCLRSGSGLVYTIVPESIMSIIQTLIIESICMPIRDSGTGCFKKSFLESIKDAVNKVDCLVLGPGMGVDEERIEIIREILEFADRPVVLDADGINCISKDKDKKALLSRQHPTVITPHPAELARLLDVTVEEIQSNRIEYCRFASKKYNVITVLKGHNTVISSPEGHTFINTTGNPGMATAGSGDVLSGMIGSLIGQKIKPLDAVIAAVFLHGLAGDIGAEEKGEYGLIAGDIVENIPYAIKYVKSNF